MPERTRGILANAGKKNKIIAQYICIFAKNVVHLQSENETRIFAYCKPIGHQITKNMKKIEIVLTAAGYANTAAQYAGAMGALLSAFGGK